jgi:rhamnose utilization protein RhaD (predicted bifunctional aldolase and dehydrogenase)
VLTAIDGNPEFDALRRFSAELGRDPLQVQGPGGNTSLKHDGVLWVKASGTWLAQATTRDIFVPVRLDPLLAAIAGPDQGAAEDVGPYVDAARNPSGLRPSIETTMHGALPHAIVVHVHCVDTMAWAAREDVEAALAKLLAGVRWAFIPYIRPGVPLTRAILDRAAPDTDVLVLGNHGLVVGGATVQEAASRLADIRARLRRPSRPPATGAARPLPKVPGYIPASDPMTHLTATDPLSLAIARKGSLYPDHVIFLGPGVTIAGPAIRDPGPPMLIVPGAGALLRQDVPAAVPALARCLADVTARLHPDEPIRVLSMDDETVLLGWDAEKYRQAVAVT